MSNNIIMVYKIQSILFDRKIYTPNTAKIWLNKHNFKSNLDIKPNHLRFRQMEPSLFIPTSFRTKNITNGISIIIGRLN